jgi:hypothetical protein
MVPSSEDCKEYNYAYDVDFLAALQRFFFCNMRTALSCGRPLAQMNEKS